MSARPRPPSNHDIAELPWMIACGFARLLVDTNQLLDSFAKHLSKVIPTIENQTEVPCEGHALYKTIVASMSGIITLVLSIIWKMSIFLYLTEMIEQATLSENIKLSLSLSLLVFCVMLVVFTFHLTRHCLHQTRHGWWQDF